ncbi:hypothetical protein Hanom_Chr03g00198751 [Helianthus anomalus]
MVKCPKRPQQNKKKGLFATVKKITFCFVMHRKGIKSLNNNQFSNIVSITTKTTQISLSSRCCKIFHNFFNLNVLNGTWLLFRTFFLPITS